MAGWDLHPQENPALTRRTPNSDIRAVRKLIQELVKSKVATFLKETSYDTMGKWFSSLLMLYLPLDQATP